MSLPGHLYSRRIPLIAIGILAIASLAILLTEPTEARPSGSAAPAALNDGNEPPNLSLAFGPKMPVPGDTVDLFVSADDPEGDEPFGYEWMLDGAPLPGSGDSPKASWTAGEIGDHLVSVTVTDSQGSFSSAAVMIQVVDPTEKLLEGQLWADVASPELGSQVQFEATVTDPNGAAPYIYYWWVDSTHPSAGGSSYSYTPQSLGEHTVGLIIDDAAGRTNRFEITLQVVPSTNKPPHLEVSVPNSVTEGEKACFYARATDEENNTPFSYLWQVDGVQQDLSNYDPLVCGNNPGYYTNSIFWVASGVGQHLVKVQVVDSKGKSAETTMDNLVVKSKLQRIDPGTIQGPDVRPPQQLIPTSTPTAAPLQIQPRQLEPSRPQQIQPLATPTPIQIR